MMRSPWSLPLRVLLFIVWFIGQLVVTSLRVTALILTPSRQPEPGIVSLPLDDLSETELTLLIALITITPDTLVIAVDREHRAMFVHGMFVAGDPDGFRSALRETHDRLLVGMRRRPDRHSARKESA